MKTWMKIRLADAIKTYDAHPDYDYKCSIDVLAWEHAEERGIDQQNGVVVSIIIGIVKEEQAEIRVQYEKEDYEAHKTNLLIQKAVKEGMKWIKEELDTYLSNRM
ncbi:MULTISPECIES: hypothetical protein [unclassified Paenibacillus]|uniref:hypothetical protein n=1 Tax=unclassified Paenibacillus TaxID=185978 RepID=UPI001AE929FC|nr:MULTISPECIES: hypothetical protein [unclassified Paenibacillus]MBP1156186.1 hypothetical protein [Paenibacillus sp. PvP091]MBP1168428.1 hypothetical protein [Paenibacillus sp. PvR098]MBP2439456.1 hypothetical protein [Paenibacillus sp. PvP052]